jgi:hypothetical protein
MMTRMMLNDNGEDDIDDDDDGDDDDGDEDEATNMPFFVHITPISL